MASAFKEVSERPLTYQDVLARDTRAAPEFFAESTVDLGTGPYLASRYTSAEFFAREIEKVWLKTWQFACREEQIPNPGDTYVFDVVGKAVIIVRQDDGSIKALQNVCLHRGRKLVTHGGCKHELECPYHGLTWNRDGTFKRNPFGWDFPQIDKGDFSLPAVRLETWGGFVFINFDDAATPLLEQLAPMPEHFAHWMIDECHIAAHVAKVVPANWKAVAEAFIEAHHIITTHPQLNTTNGYDSGQYDVLSEHVSRFLNPGAITPAVYPEDLTEEDRLALVTKTGGRFGAVGDRTAQSGMTARNYTGDAARRNLSEQTGYDFEATCDAELIDGMSYAFFPNFHLWGGFKDKICYRFRPNGMEHEETLMEVILLRITPKGQPRPAPRALNMLADDQDWSEAEELGFLATVYDQDQSNMGPVQEGLRALGSDGVINFSQYLEVRCRHLHATLDRYMAR